MARIDFVTGNARIYLPEVEALAGVPDRLEEALAQRTSAELRRTGSDGRSGARIAGDFVAYAEHDQAALYRMAWMSDPVIPPLDADAVAAEAGWEGRSAGDLITRLTHAIEETVDLLKDQPDASWGRPGLFEDGRRSLRQQVRQSIAHYDAQLSMLVAALAAPAAR